MPNQVPPDVAEKLLRFAKRRIQCIRKKDRKGLDATYDASCLRLRNKYNRNDYKWYLNLIEHGFDEPTVRIDIESADSGPLPFAGIVTFAAPFDYKIFVQTVSGRRTLWLTDLSDDGPRVVLPAFNGNTGDKVVTGQWQMPTTAEPECDRVTFLEFERAAFVQRVIESLTDILAAWSGRLKYETIRAATVSCAPWHHGMCDLGLLTTQEDFDDNGYFGKWDIGAWRWGDMETLPVEIGRLIYAYYEGNTTTDRKKDGGQRAKVIFECLAEALESNKVAAVIQRYKRTTDFELGVFSPDRRSYNFCGRKRKK